MARSVALKTPKVGQEGLLHEELADSLLRATESQEYHLHSPSETNFMTAYLEEQAAHKDHRVLTSL